MGTYTRNTQQIEKPVTCVTASRTIFHFTEEKMTEEQGKKLIEYAKELARQHNELEAKVERMERRVEELEAQVAPLGVLVKQ
jgi:predicted RNase H-like nuclease (RuvC/YqgF family)